MRHRNRTLSRLTIAVVVFFMILQGLAPEFTASVSLWVLLASVVVVGIPHGAIDHIIAAELYELNQTVKDHLMFYASYLLVMMVVGALWILLPAGGMILFLLISIYHFGQADMEDFMPGREPGFRIHYLNRGWLIIGLILFSDTTITLPIIEDAIRVEPGTVAGFVPEAETAVVSTLAIYLTISVAGMLSGTIHRKRAYLTDSIILIACLLVTGPLIGFAIYFALWHSSGHIREMRTYFDSLKKPLSIAGFYKKAAPFTLVSFAGLGLLFWINSRLGLENQFITLMFILISVLTLPHMLIVERMYREKTTSAKQLN